MRKFFVGSAICASAFLAGCGGGAQRQAVDLEWNAGQTWHVAASYRVAANKTPEIATALEGGEAHWVPGRRRPQAPE